MQLKKGHVLQGSLLLGITAIQFHLPFYMSRTLPNTFATCLACLALGDWISRAHPRRAIVLLVFGTVRNCPVPPPSMISACALAKPPMHQSACMLYLCTCSPPQALPVYVRTLPALLLQHTGAAHDGHSTPCPHASCLAIKHAYSVTHALPGAAGSAAL